MLVQLMADLTRSKKTIGDLIECPDTILKKYPGLTKKQVQLLKKRDLPGLCDEMSKEVNKHFSKPAYSVLYVGVDLEFKSIDPDSSKINEPVDMTMVLSVSQAPLPSAIMSSVQFTRRATTVDAKVSSTVYNKKALTITIKMKATFPDAGSYSASVKLWEKGAPKHNAELPATGNIFKATKT